MNTNQPWGLRSILGPVLTRLIIYGTHPVDVEHAMQTVEQAPMRNALDLEKNWANVWQERAEKYLDIAKAASTNSTQKKMYQLATQCYYATFLINYAEHETKVALYKKYAEYYYKTCSLQNSIEKISVPISSTDEIPAYLHTPKGSGPFPCTIVLAGLGSCKEEMEIFVRPLLERGIAALVPDLPGCGESIYSKDIKCSKKSVENAIAELVRIALTTPQIDSKKLGAAGLCMGGGLAYKAACHHKELQFAATLFPLLIDKVADEMIPSWMKSGKWFHLISGMENSEEFIKEMGLSESDKLDRKFLMMHSKHDNWMTLDMAKEAMFDKVSGEKKLVVIDEEPVLTSKDAITHSMPVGEQMHWAKEVLVDWIYETVNGL